MKTRRQLTLIGLVGILLTAQTSWSLGPMVVSLEVRADLKVQARHVVGPQGQATRDAADPSLGRQRSSWRKPVVGRGGSLWVPSTSKIHSSIV